MNSKEILTALKAGKLNHEEAKIEYLKINNKPVSTYLPSSRGSVRAKYIKEARINAGKDPQKNAAKKAIEQAREKTKKASTEAVAIIGLSGRYPGAKDLYQYWENLVNAKEAIKEIPDSRWNVGQYYDPDPAKEGKTYCKWLGALDDIACFDPLFFNIAPSEADMMDPQHRLFLEEAHKAFEDSGYNHRSLSKKKCGVYLGIMSSEYNTMSVRHQAGITNLTANSYAIGAARLSYFFNLKGPAIPIDTACSSSLVAAHLACQALLNQEIDLALVGGVSLYLTPDLYIGMCATKMLSVDGRCKTFDNRADGFVPAEGVGALVLKRLSEAENDNDLIHGVIIGSGINQDGKTNGITAPSINSQIELEREIYNKYKINPESISYAEMHGTGTKLGDPIELEALSTVFKEKTSKRKYCAIGSVKSNIGHTSAAAGVAGVQKVLLCLKNRKLVPTLNFKTPNEHYDFEDSPFFVNTELKSWETPPHTPRRACVSAFGFSGTNAHLVIEEYCPKQIKAISPPIGPKPVLFVLSAKSKERLKIYSKKMRDFIEYREDLNIENLAYTLQTGREAMACRLAFVADSQEAVIKALDGFIDNNLAANILYAKVKKHQNRGQAVNARKKERMLCLTYLKNGELDKASKLWVKGVEPDWERFYSDTKKKNKPWRMSLPTYPFAKEYYWITRTSETSTASLNISKDFSKNTRQTSDEVTDEKFGTLLFEPVWKEERFGPAAAFQTHPVSPGIVYQRHMVFLCEPGIIWKSISLNDLQKTSQDNLKEDFRTRFQRGIEAGISGACCSILHSEEQGTAERFQTYALQVFTEIKKILRNNAEGNVLVQIVVPSRGDCQLFSGLAGLLKTARLENPKLVGQLLELEPNQELTEIIQKLQENRQAIESDPSFTHIRYQNGQRRIARWQEIQASPAQAILRQTPIPWKEDGIYLITGGAGGLGLIFAREIARQVRNPLIILTGRSVLNSKKLARLKEIKLLGAKIEYKQADVTRQQAVKNLIENLQQQYGVLTGIIHSAGINKDNYILKKTSPEIRAVLAPKVTGLINLDLAAKDLPLDFFILFSSTAGVMGNIGQADYACANAFMDAYAKYRQTLTYAKQRHGRTLAINWPLWQEGGMQIDQETAKIIKSHGITPIATTSGIEAFYQALTTEKEQVLILTGAIEKIRRNYSQVNFAQSPSHVNNEAFPEIASKIDPELLWDKTLFQLKVLLGEIIKLNATKIDPDEPLESYGIDSITITRLNQRLALIFGELSKTLFFEYKTLGALTKYFVTNHFKECRQWTGTKTYLSQSDPLPLKTQGKIADQQPSQITFVPGKQITREPLAIIGMSGRYPQAENLKEYWKNLKTGKDCISEIPADRWPLEGFYHPNIKEAIDQGKSYSKWGGFLERFADFDPLFFSLSPRDAFEIDPQERLFIQACWEVIEDAGYTRERLATKFKQKIGVFVGITKTGFDLYSPDLWKEGEQVYLHTSFSSVANRISYLLDFKGPSMPIDTMCSSSLTAIHEACQHLYLGECEMAIAGGVNLYLHPSSYIGLCAKQMLSQDGKCKSFGRGSNGFVPGEGVGAVLLKPLSKAIADQDRIHALIRGTGINHGGKTNGYTVPSPAAQAEVIRSAMEKAGVNSRAITYIEAHGTGTKLGDPIEITGLNQAFRQNTKDTGFCALGSVKSNIGHLEAAAGIAGVTKIVLQMQNKELVPTLYVQELNPNINIKATPFKVQRELEKWRRPLIESDGQLRKYSRIAGISSFGAGGANAHVIIEEYIPQKAERPQINLIPRNPLIIILSAKNEEQLQEQAGRLLTVSKEREYSTTDLLDLAYTLQVGREAMEERLGLLVISVKDLQEKLQAFLEKREGIEDLFSGQVKQHKDTLAFLTDEDMAKTIEVWISKKKYKKLLELWVKGLNLDWNKLYGKIKPHRISLPPYPFARERYWLPEIKPESQVNKETEAKGKIHTGARPATDGKGALLEIKQKGKVEPLSGNITLVPVWEPVSPKFEKTGSTTGEIVIFAEKNSKSLIQEYYPQAQFLEIETGQQDITAIANKLRLCGQISHILWLAPQQQARSLTDEVLIEEQEFGILQVFRVIKALLTLGYESRDLNWGMITFQTQPIFFNESINPAHSALFGLMGSLTKEYPNWQVRLIDLEEGCAWPAVNIFDIFLDPQNNPIVYRSKEWYRVSYVPVNRTKPTRTLYKKGGVYVVIGGAGGIGEVWSEYMLIKYQARIIWLGRRKKNAAIQAKLDRLSALGPAPIYLTADASDYHQLHQAYDEIKRQYSKIHGIIQAAVGLLDRSLVDMDETKFKAGLAAKINVSIRMAQIFEQEALDFVLFFSSMSALIKDHGKSSYCAGSTFMDIFAHELAQKWSCRVKVINLGYWGIGIGNIVPAIYKKRLKKMGFGSIDPQDAMEALETLLSEPLNQIALVKTTESKLALEAINTEELFGIYPEKITSVIQNIKNPILVSGYPFLQIKSELDPLIKEIDHFMCRLLWGQLQSMGLFRKKNAAMADLKAGTGLRDLYERWLDESIAFFTQNNLLTCDGKICSVIDTTPVDMIALWKEWDLKKGAWLKNPGTKPSVILAEETLKALPEILTGKVAATDIMFPDASMELVEGLYKNNPLADYFNEVLADTLTAYIQARLKHDSFAKLRIFEIGAGTGGTSAMVFKKLKPYREHIQEYCYTDVSKAFLLHAEREYGQKNHFLTCQVFNAEEPIFGQNIRAGEYDVVIAANVLHATKNIRQTLRNTKAILKKNGLLLLNEMSDKDLFRHLTFGLLEGWWLYEDAGLRLQGCPGISPENWQALLESEGFRSVFFPTQQAHEIGQQIIVAESDGVIRQRQLYQRGESPVQPRIEKRRSENNASKLQHLTPAKNVTRELLREKGTAYIKKIVGEILKISANKIDSSEPLEKYGFDSILLVHLTNALKKVFNNISNILLYEVQTIDALVERLMQTHKVRFTVLVGLEGQELPESDSQDHTLQTHNLQGASLPARKIAEPGSKQPGERLKAGIQESFEEPIAIIGISGHYPQAKNLAEYWQNLKTGKDCILEIPEERWPLVDFYHPDRQEAMAHGKSYSKWGGFLEGFADFDPLFFNISPKEAICMDPQERLFIKASWEVLEDAGYTRERLALQHNRRVGVFSGITKADFNLYGPELWKQGEAIRPYTSFSSVANRVSYLLNLQGPSMPVDTMCSSSLTAIHMACEHLRRGACEMAISGGVNLYLHPSSYIGLCTQQMLAASKKSVAFGLGDNGFVPGEGVGCVLLKPLSMAQKDKDHIYAVIIGSSVNHNGKTNGYFVPDINAMSDLIQENITKTGVDPRSISYVEAAAYGSKIGDSIEIEALTRAFSRQTADRQFCAIGSVKPNIGHLESASGISQLTKVVLQLQNRQLVPSLNFEPQNPDICFSKTPFYLSLELTEWKRPVLEVNGTKQEFPRRAAIDSFGAGGSNAHLIIEEYIPKPSKTIRVTAQAQPQIVVLSARTHERLRVVVEQLVEFIKKNKNIALTDVAYTLQIGREEMKVRLAVVASTSKELQQTLLEYLKVNQEELELEPGGKFFRGDLTKQPRLRLLLGESGEAIVQTLIEQGDFTKIAHLWTQGEKIPWSFLHQGKVPKKMSLPAYPFEPKKYWLPLTVAPMTSVSPVVVERSLEPAKLHGLHNIKGKVAELSGIPVAEVPVVETLASLGLNSIKAMTLKYMLEQDFKREIPLGAVNEYKTIEQIAKAIKENRQDGKSSPDSSRKMDNTAKQMQNCSREKNGLQKAKNTTEVYANVLPVIIPDAVNKYQPFPLSDIQESFLTGRRLHFGGDWVGCHIYFELEEQNLDIYRLSKAWRNLIHYHGMLRSVILPSGEQKILEKVQAYHPKVIDLRRKTEPELSRHLEKMRQYMSHKVYQAEKWPLFEICISIFLDKYLIHFSVDELIMDASSVYLLLNQWWRLYKNPNSKLPGLTVSFRDYVLAVKQFENSRRYKRDLAYWIEELEKMPEGPKQVIYPKASNPEDKANYYRTRLSGHLTEKQWQTLQHKARKLQVSGTVLLLSIFSEFLRIANSKKNYSLLLTFFNRSPIHPQLDRVVGPFISTIIFVAKKYKGSLAGLIRDNQARLRHALDHSSVSGIRVLRELKARGKITNSLFLPVVFTSMITNLQDNVAVGRKRRGFRQVTYMVTQTPQVYLDHQIREENGKLMFSWDVPKSYLGGADITKLFARYCEVLEVLAAKKSEWPENLEVETDPSLSRIKKDSSYKAFLPLALKLEKTPDEKYQPYPLTDQQQAYAFGRSSSLTAGKENCLVYLEIEANQLDVGQLEKAWQKIIDNHEMLCTVIYSHGTQKTLEKVPEFKIKVTDFRGKNIEDVQAELTAIRDSMFGRIFDLGKWPYFDLRVSCVDDVRSLVHFSIDLLIADGNSIQLLLKQLFEHYNNPEKEPSPKGLAFRDYVMSLEKYQKSEAATKSIKYWEKKFKDLPPGPQLSLKLNQGQTLSYQREQLQGIVEDWGTLLKIAQQFKVAPGMVLLTAYLEVWAEFLNQEPFSIVIPSWTRLPLHPKIDQVVGDFTAMSWVVRRREDQALTFAEKVQLTHQTVQEDHSHMAVSGLKVLRKAVLRRKNKTPLVFPVVFSDLAANLGFEDIQGFCKVKMLSKTPQVYLDNISEEQDGKLFFHWDITKGGYPMSLMKEMFTRYRQILELLVAEPDSWQSVSMTSGQRRAI